MRCAGPHTNPTPLSVAKWRRWRPNGIPETDISRVVGIDPKTLRKCYREQLDLGETKANAQVAGSHCVGLSS